MQRDKYEKAFLILARAITVGIAYVSAIPIKGLTSSFVAIFTALLPFDLIVASAHPLVRFEEWKNFLTVLRPRVSSTAITLLKGIVVGTAIGIFGMLGLPRVLGIVLTSGLAYVWAVNTRYAISTYVSILSGLALFERLIALEVSGMVGIVQIVQEILGAIASSGGGTFMGLIAGWLVGLMTGSVTRLFLSRPYRSLRSSAYDLPLEKRPFDEVLQIGQTSLLVVAKVEEGAPIAHLTLAQSNLREAWRTMVLSVKRGGEEFVMPKGSFAILPGDELVMLTEREHVELLHEQLKAPQTIAPDQSSTAMM